MSNHQNNMKQTAKRLAQQGRNGDSVLVHMSPGELAGLKALAYEHGTELTINPVTGLPEAFKLKKLFKKLLGPALGVLSNFILPGNPWGAAALTAALTKATGKSWKQSLLAGAGAGLGNVAGAKFAGAGKLATETAAKAGITEAAKKTAVDAALRNATGESLSQLGQSAAKEGAKSFLSNLGKGVSTSFLGGEAGRAAGLTALGGKLGAAGLGASVLLGGEPSKFKPMDMPKSKYWVGKGKPLWNLGEWNPETGEYEGQGYGEGEFTEDVDRAARGYADGGSVNNELFDVLTPNDMASLTGLAAVDYGNPANADATRVAPGIFATPEQPAYTNDPRKDRPVVTRSSSRPAKPSIGPGLPKSRPKSGFTTSGVDPNMRKAPRDLDKYYKKYLMSPGGGQTPNRRINPLNDYLADLETSLMPTPPSPDTAGPGTGQTLNSRISELGGGQNSYTAGWNFVNTPNGMAWVPSGLASMGFTGPMGPRGPTQPGATAPGTSQPPAGGYRFVSNELFNNPYWQKLSQQQRLNYANATTPELRKQFRESLSDDQKKLRSSYTKTRKKAGGGTIQGYVAGGTTYAAAGKLLRGPGDGMSDSIPAVIRGNPPQKAALGDGEFVIPADVVANLGNGSTQAGAKQLYAMMDRVRVAKNGKKEQPRAINPKKYMPA